MFQTCLKIPVTGMKTDKIKVIAASVQGPQHSNKNLPCQDYCRYSHRGKNFVAVVSDGAGSAKFGKIGARIVCDTLIDLLKNINLKNAKEAVRQGIEVARSKITRHRFNHNNIADFSATVVGVVYYRNQGMFFHIGDGAALALYDDNYDNFIASPPENGSFSCETYFYTQDNWNRNLRFTAFEKADTIFLMSDGLTNFSFAPDYRRIEKGFILPINNFLKEENTKTKAERALINTLNTEQARKLNSDDKTLLWAKL